MKTVNSAKRVKAVIEFIQTLPVPDGELAGTTFKLRDWQKTFIRDIYGPRSGDRRVVKQALLSIARKNGKTALIAALLLVHLCGPEAVRNGQLYSIAFEREQAGVVFNYVIRMIYADAELDQRLRVVETHKRIVDTISGSEFVALSRDSRSKHGKSSSFLIFDELAQFGAKRDMYDTMMTSTGAHDDALSIIISTQAPDDLSLLSELIDYGRKVNAGEIDDATVVCQLYAVPEDETDIFNEDVWYLANPALGDFRSIQEFREYAAKVQRMPGMMQAFRNLYLNQRVDATETFISRDVWQQCEGEPEAGAFAGNPVYLAIDLSQKNDLTAIAVMAMADNVAHCKMEFFKPGDCIREHEDRDKAPYVQWHKAGYITGAPGRVVDFTVVARRILQIDADNGIEAIAVDPWKIEELRKAIREQGRETYIVGKEDVMEGALPLYIHSQGFRDMSDAIQTLEDLLATANLRHGANPVLTMCAMNAVVEMDAAGNRKFIKRQQHKRIDGIVALAMVVNLEKKLRGAIREASVYEGRGVRSF